MSESATVLNCSSTDRMVFRFRYTARVMSGDWLTQKDAELTIRRGKQMGMVSPLLMRKTLSRGRSQVMEVCSSSSENWPAV